MAKTAANTSDTTKSEPKSNYIRIFLFFALFISAVVLAFIYSDNGNFLTGNIVSSETPFENVIVGRNILDGERIDINKEVSSRSISGIIQRKRLCESLCGLWRDKGFCL
jgi:hypothetical protein